MGLVGESGCGKSTLALAVMRLLAGNGMIKSGQIKFDGKELLSEEPDKMRQIRGKEIGMVFQDPLSSLTPTRTIGNHLIETILAHEDVDRGTADNRSKMLLERVGIPADRFSEYPHQFSGGMRQRVAIAAALVCNPRLILLDEPTSALDVTLQQSILALLRDLQRDFELTILLISHDLGVVAEICETISVMYAGRIVEFGPLRKVAERPSHGYTRGLLASLPHTGRAHVRPLSSIPGRLPGSEEIITGCIFRNRCVYFDEIKGCADVQTFQKVETGHMAKCTRFTFVSDTSWLAMRPEPILSKRPKTGDMILMVDKVTKLFGRTRENIPFLERWLPHRNDIVRAVDNVSIHVNKGETLGIVGESGSGKTTLARMIVRLLKPTKGSIKYRDSDVLQLKGTEARMYHRAVQIIFQDPDSTLNPRRRVFDVLERRVELMGIVDDQKREERVLELLDMVHIPASYASRYPHEMSGGEKQRIGIARSLALEPEIIVCDEPVSALDVSVAAAILNLLVELQSRLGMTYIFITHDLSVVQHIADRVAVMHEGTICEQGKTEEIFSPPHHPYTEKLLSAVPSRLYEFVGEV